VTGRYFEDCNEAVVLTEPGDGTSGVAPTPSIRTTPTASGTKRPGSCTANCTNPYAQSRARLIAAITTLLDAGISAGTLRADVEPNDVLLALSGVSLAAGAPDQREQAGRLLDLLVDGLRHHASASAPKWGACELRKVVSGGDETTDRSVDPRGPEGAYRPSRFRVLY
jgi:hypothetical protein